MLKILKKFFAFCGEENRHRFYHALVLGVLIAFFEVLRIPAIAVVLSAVLERNITDQALFNAFSIMLVSILGQGIFKYKSNMLQTRGGYIACANKRIEIAEHLRYLPMGYFNQNSLGQITSVTTNSMEHLSDVATRVVMVVSSGILTTALITVMLAVYDIRISLIVIIGLMLYYGANALLQKKSAALVPDKIRSDSVLVEKVLEYLQGISEVKAYGLVGQYFRKLDEAIDANVKVNTDMEMVLVPPMALQNIISKMIGIAVATASIFFWHNGTMPLLNCILMLCSAFMLTAALEGAGNYSALLRVVDKTVDLAQTILDLPPMDIDGEDSAPTSFALDMENVCFSYGEKSILKDVTLHIPEGSTTAIVGPSGGGKTTICNLLSRFWDVEEGVVRLGGKDVREYSIDSLMRNFSFVFQNVFLFHDTIANNIRFGQPEASMEQVISAAKKAQCHDFIMNLPDGYETRIGEGGGSLSGGERQRISIARAMMKDAPIIILDEATANIDPENEKELMDAIAALTASKTVIMIAHRLKTVEKAEQILVVDHGRIVQRGKHKELMQADGIYRRFVETRKQAVSWKI